MSNGQTDGKERVTIRQLPTGVPGFDEILGGGLPEYSFNIIAGAPGSGKTTLAHQFMFANASPERKALYFTILGEPAVKMLRYQQQFTFFDQSKLDGSIRFVNLSQLVLEQDLNAVLEEIVKQVEASDARIVVVDSFRTVVRRAQVSATEMELQGSVQRLALHLTSWQATVFLVGEYVEGEIRDNPVFTVGKMLVVVKMRGSEHSIDMWEFKVTGKGVVIGEPLRGYRGLTSGIPSPWPFESGENHPELRRQDFSPEWKGGPNE